MARCRSAPRCTTSPASRWSRPDEAESAPPLHVPGRAPRRVDGAPLLSHPADSGTGKFWDGAPLPLSTVAVWANLVRKGQPCFGSLPFRARTTAGWCGVPQTVYTYRRRKRLMGGAALPHAQGSARALSWDVARRVTCSVPDGPAKDWPARAALRKMRHQPSWRLGQQTPTGMKRRRMLGWSSSQVRVDRLLCEDGMSATT